MAGGKETPRQRMMGILYLVLLGLVALSVPDSLMDAFKNIRKSLDTSTANVDKGLQTTLSNFEATKLKEEHDRAQPIFNRAKIAQKAAKDLNDFVDTLSNQLIQKGDGIDPKTEDVDKRENLDISPHMMVTEKKGEQLRDKIEQTKKTLMDQLKPDERNGITLSLNTDPPKQKSGSGVIRSWEEAYFGDGIPLGATLTTLAKIKADNKNAENEVIKKILSEIEKAVVTLDKFDAVAVAPTSYVLVGQPYTADVFLTAYDSKQNPDISVNGVKLAAESGKGKYVGSTSSEGLHTWSAVVNVKQADGKIVAYKTPAQTYMVARPSAVVSPTKMNVLYIGVPNPIAVSAPGIDKGALNVSMSGGSISGTGGNYTVMVKTLGQVTINVSGKLAGGKTATLGSSNFRVKRIPDPKPVFAGKSGGSVSAANLRAQDRVFARLENFDFDAKFNVTRFTLLIANPRQDAQTFNTSSGELSSTMRAAMNSIKPGSIVVFKDIVAVGPDGTSRGLDQIAFSAN